MATEKRLIYLEDAYEAVTDLSGQAETKSAYAAFWKAGKAIQQIPTVDAVPVDDIKLHHVIIDNEGVPEVKLQIGDRYFILRTDPVDVREVVHGRWIWSEENGCWVCSNCEMSALNNYRGNSTDSNYCPNCGAKMDGDRK